MSTADVVCTSLLGVLALAAIAGCALLVLDDGAPINVRPVTPADWADVAGIEPVSGVPVSPNLHHVAEGRVPGPVTGRATAATPGRHAGPGRGRRTHRAACHAEPRIFTWSTL